MRTKICTVAVLVTGILFAASPISAQPGSGPTGTGTGLSIGPRVLVDFETSDLTLGGEVRFAPPAPDFLQFRALYDFTFLDGLTERTFAFDALLATGGFAIGGGPVIRNTRLTADDPREDFTGWSAVLMLGGDPRTRGRFNVGLELRWIFVDPFEPRTLGVVVGVPLV
jgi:hypothetical protein